MNVLITGAFGINGVRVVRELLEEGHRPVIFDNRIDLSSFPDISDKLDIVLGDILDIGSIIRALKEYKITRIIHLAAIMPQEASDNPMKGFNVNALGTVNILEASRIMDIERVVFASAKAALGPITGEYGHPTYKPVDESYCVGRPNVYSAAKVASELMGFSYAKLYGLEFVALRFATIYGMGKAKGGWGSSVVGDMIGNAMLGKPTEIPQGGDAKMDMLYVKDCGHSIVLACLNKKVPHNLYHIGAGNGHTLQELADCIKELYPNAIFKIGSGLDLKGSAGQYFVMDISLAKKELGYIPRYNLLEGVRDYAKEMKKS